MICSSNRNNLNRRIHSSSTLWKTPLKELINLLKVWFTLRKVESLLRMLAKTLFEGCYRVSECETHYSRLVLVRQLQFSRTSWKSKSIPKLCSLKKMIITWCVTTLIFFGPKLDIHDDGMHSTLVVWWYKSVFLNQYFNVVFGDFYGRQSLQIFKYKSA